MHLLLSCRGVLSAVQLRAGLLVPADYRLVGEPERPRGRQAGRIRQGVLLSHGGVELLRTVFEKPSVPHSVMQMKQRYSWAQLLHASAPSVGHAQMQLCRDSCGHTRTFMQAMHQVWRPSGPLGSRLNCAIFFSSRQCTQTRSAGPSVLLRFDGRSSCRRSDSGQLFCVTPKARWPPGQALRQQLCRIQTQGGQVVSSICCWTTRGICNGTFVCVQCRPLCSGFSPPCWTMGQGLPVSLPSTLAFMQPMQCGCSPPGPLAFRWNCVCALTTKHLVHCRSDTVTSPVLCRAACVAAAVIH